MEVSLTHWKARLAALGVPVYQGIPLLLREDLRSGRLSAGDRLPALRALASQLDLDYTTVARAYGEARRLGLVDSAPGRGTVVRAPVPRRSVRPVSPLEMTMNMPPESRDPEILSRLQSGLDFIGHLADPHALLRYQEFGGTLEDREAAAAWLQAVLPGVDAARVLVTPGIQGALASVMGLLAAAGEVILAEPVTYPGVKAMAAQLGVRVAALACDADGVLPAAFEHACRELKPRLLYLNPTLSNPTCQTVPLARREALADIALRHSVPIVEDDAYGMLLDDPLPAFAQLAPEQVWYLTGLAKCLGAGLRIGFLVPPDAARRRLAASALRTTTIMASPVTMALATHWLRDGTADLMLAAVRQESRARQKLVREVLADLQVQTQPEAFHCWLHLPDTVHRLPLAASLRQHGMAAVASDTFTMEGTPPNAIRLCLGGELARGDCRQALLRVREHIDLAGAAPDAAGLVTEASRSS